jgi:hypothetical protein
MDAHFVVLKHPFPLVLAVDTSARLITAQQAAPPQAGEELRHPVVQAGFDPMEQVRQGPFTAREAEDLHQEPRQSLVTDRMGITQVGRETLDGGPKGGAGFHPHRDRGHIGLPTVGTLPPILFHTGDDRLDWG